MLDFSKILFLKHGNGFMTCTIIEDWKGMMAKGILRKLWKVHQNVSAEISGNARQGGLYAAGLASEGYAGGYRAAINDVMLALRGRLPCVHPEYWIDTKEERKNNESMFR